MKHETSAEIIISGKVVMGDGYGKKIGFPTANLDRKQFVGLKKKPKLGVWAGSARITNYELRITSYNAGIVVGPVDKKGLPKVEAHLIGYKGNLYGKKIELKLIKYLRPFKKYKGEEDLKRQIAVDINKIKKLKF